MSEQLQVQRGTYFAVVLYPEEDYKHQQFLEYVLMRPQYEVAYIEHLPEQGDNKKHVHCLVHVKQKMTVGSFIKYFDPWIKYAECIHNSDGYLAYMLHDTPKAMQDGKIPYPLDALKGDRKLWKNLVQNSNFVQLREFFMYMHDGDTLLDIIKRIEDSGVDPSPYLEYIHANSFLAVSICNQEINKYYKELQYLKSEVFN